MNETYIKLLDKAYFMTKIVITTSYLPFVLLSYNSKYV